MAADFVAADGCRPRELFQRYRGDMTLLCGLRAIQFVDGFARREGLLHQLTRAVHVARLVWEFGRAVILHLFPQPGCRYGAACQAEGFAIRQEAFFAAARQACRFIGIHNLCDFHDNSPRIYNLCLF